MSSDPGTGLGDGADELRASRASGEALSPDGPQSRGETPGGSRLPTFGDPAFFEPLPGLVTPVSEDGASHIDSLPDYPIDGPDSITDDQFADLVGDALSSIPQEFLDQIENLMVVIEDENPDEPHLLGLYEGVPLTERSSYSGAMPDLITIYRLPILRICHTAQEVREEVRITVIHEVGHYFGIDDDRLHELGWG